MQNKITIIIPVYNAEKTIERALSSLISNKDFIQKVIIINDYSTDKTEQKIHKFESFLPISIIHNTNVSMHNPGAARKIGLLETKSEWVTFLDADDCLTPGSLYYVSKHLKENLVLLHCQQIFYESGTFDKDNIDFSIYSCGGNFYKTKYLLDNQLFPHETLKKAEDEYFNRITINHIAFSSQSDLEEYFEYPVYEVHHDIEIYRSYAFENWGDYLCKYHLLASIYIVNFFQNKKADFYKLKVDFMEDFIFCFFLIQGLMLDKDINFDLNQNKIYFKQHLEYFEKFFKTNRQNLINYFYTHLAKINKLLKGANISTGMTYQNYLPFKQFVLEL